MTRDPQHAVVHYPGGLRASYRWGGSGQGGAVFALSETGGPLTEYGDRVAGSFEELCRAELRVEGPGGAWAARLASPIYDQPSGLLWDSAGLLVVRYGFLTYAFEARSGALRWSHRSASPLVGVFGSSRLDHVIIQGEIETFAVDAAGEVRWRVAHSDVVTEAELVGGRLVLASYSGQLTALDPLTGRVAG